MVFLSRAVQYLRAITMGKDKKVRKFAAVKRMISPKDMRMYVFECIATH